MNNLYWEFQNQTNYDKAVKEKENLRDETRKHEPKELKRLEEIVKVAESKLEVEEKVLTELKNLHDVHMAFEKAESKGCIIF